MARAASGTTGDGFRTPSPEELVPLYLVHGEEDLLVDEIVDELLDVAVPDEQRSFNLDVIQGEEADGRDIVARASAFPMMADRRAVVVRNVEKLSGRDLDAVAGYVDHPSPSTVFVLTGGKVDMRRKPFVSIKKGGAVFECKPLKEAQVPSWIARRMKGKGRSIDGEACSLLSSLVGRSLRELDHELDKLILFAGVRETVTSDDVAAVVGVSRQYNIFELQRAVGMRDVHRAGEILARMLETGNGAPYFIVMLTTYFTTLWRIHDWRSKGMNGVQIAAEMKRDQWQIAEYLDAVQRYTRKEVERAFGILLSADERSKSGAAEADVLHAMLIELMAGQEENTAPRLWT